MLDLYPYQETGRDFLLCRRYALLADDPGLGKTAQSIRAAKWAGLEKILVICPKSAISNWFKEFRLWWPDGPTPTVINFDLFSAPKHTNAAGPAMQEAWDLVIIDEAHRLKSKGAKRTKNIYGKLIPQVDRVWLLTGTPAPNHNGELWTHLRALVPGLIPDVNGKPLTSVAFEDHYCKVFDHPHFGRSIQGNKNTPELREKIAPFFIRRLKKEVLPELPDLRFAPYPLQVDPKKCEVQLPAGFEDVDEENLLELLRQHSGSLSTERRLTGLSKVAAAGALIHDLLEDTEKKLIVFAHHRDVLDGLQEATRGIPSVRIDGQVPSGARADAVDAFQDDPNTKIFFGQISACGEALTLTASDTVLFVEASWTPSDNYQAACRAHRIGQKNAVTAYMLSIEGSLDDVIANTCARKAREIAELFG